MRMLPVASLVLLAALAAADEPSPSTTVPPPSPPAVQKTVVRGTVPDLVGRWLVMGAIKLPSGKERVVPGLWEVAKQDGEVVLTIRFANLPAAQQAAVAKANEEEKAWHPTPDDLAAVRAGWDAMAPQDPKIATIDTELIGRDAFDDAMQKEAISKDATFVVRQAEVFSAAASPTLRQVNLYAITASRPDGFGANYTLAVVAAAPFPIPIALNGTAELYRLDPPAGGLLGRLLDVFRGCGR